MKKFLAVILSVLLLFTLTACNKETENTDSSTGEIALITNKNSAVSSENKAADTIGNFVSGSSKSNTTNNNTNQSTKNNSSQSTVEASSKGTVTNDDNANKSTQSTSSESKAEVSSETTVTNNNNINSGSINNGVLEAAKVQQMNVPENMELISTNDAKEENKGETVYTTVVLYQLDGDVVNWTTENDLIYAITSGNNRLVVINSKNMMPVANVPLAGKPAEINLIGDKIYISLPDLCRIDIFSKSSFAKTSSLYFEHEVSSFCIDGNYIYYSEHDQHCKVFRKNMTTNELTKILSDSGGSLFYYPKLYLNKQDNILYIGESGSSGSTLFYYDATTLQLKSVFRKNDYGMYNSTRDIFHVGDDIFWANYRFSDTNAKEIIGRYGVANGSVNFASEELVSTFEGIFLTDTYECIVNYFEADFRFEYLLVTKSYNIFFRARSIDKNIIIGVNYNMQ